MVPTSYTTFNNYFVKKRIMWMSFAQSLIGIGSMFYPVLMQKLLEAYGFRGCLMVLAAINAHAILGMLLMQPVEWHMREVPIEDEEIQENNNTLPSSNNNSHRVSLQLNDNVIEEEPLASNGNNENDANHLSPLMFSRKSSRKLSRDMLEKISSRCSSITSLGNWTGPIVVTDASPEMSNILGSRRTSVMLASHRGSLILPAPKPEEIIVEEKRSVCQIIIDFLDLTLLKKPIYVNIVLGISFALYSDIAFFTLQPLYMFELGFNKVGYFG